MKRILFLAPHPPKVSPSQRFRFEHYLDALASSGFEFDYYGFLDNGTWEIFFKPGNIYKKVTGILKGFGKRIFLLPQIGKYDFVFIHREAAPVGPPFIEWWISHVARKKIIYDFDDAIWLKMASESNPYAGLLKWPGKVKHICRYAYKVSVGNEFLAAYAKQYNANVLVVPTVVDTDKLHNQIKLHQSHNLTIGWTGTFTNFLYPQSLLPVIKQLQLRNHFRFLIIADRDPLFKECSYEFLPWNKSSEIRDLLQFDIGLMPLFDTEVAKGKCAFKAIQYMALGIPAVVSNVGANVEVVDNGFNGFICNNDEEWQAALQKLLEDELLRAAMGKRARQKIVDQYSVAATRQLFISLFN